MVSWFEEKQHIVFGANSPYTQLCMCVTVLFAYSEHDGPGLHMQGIVAILSPQSAFTMATPTTICLHARAAWDPGRMCVCVCVMGVEGLKHTSGTACASLVAVLLVDEKEFVNI